MKKPVDLNELKRLSKLIKNNGRGGFDVSASRMLQAEWIYKPSWMPYQSFSSTVGNKVYVGNFFDGYEPHQDFWKCMHVLHETQHLFQWDKLGKYRMTFSYATKYGRLSLEKGANRQEIFWAIANHKLPHPNTWGEDPKIHIRKLSYFQHEMEDLRDNYMVKSNADDFYDWALQAIYEGFRLGYHQN